MCGRYVHPDEAAIEREFHLSRTNSNPFPRRFNVAPTAMVPILRQSAGGALELALARWSFVPRWWRQPKPPGNTFNARSEEAASKPMWRDAYSAGAAHCVVVAESWYEWRQREVIDPRSGEIKTLKQPYNIYRADCRPACFAGLMSAWRADRLAEPILTCAILTQPAVPALAGLHDRMPVVLDQAQLLAWTDPALRAAPRADELLARAHRDFAFHPVRTWVNSSKAEGAELIEPADDD